MLVDGTNTVTGEDRWHRVVTSSEPARAVIPTAFFVCFVKAVLQTQKPATSYKHQHTTKTNTKEPAPVQLFQLLYVFFVYFVSSFANSNSEKQTQDNDKHLMAWFSYPSMTSSFANVFWW